MIKQKQITSIYNPNMTKNISIDALFEEFKPKRNMIWKIDQKNTNWTFSHVQSTNILIRGTYSETLLSEKH